jgi:hypothetical protein
MVAVRHHRVDVEQRGRLLHEQRVELPVSPGVIVEIAGADGLALGHGGDELVLGHGLKGVVGATLLTERRAGLPRQLPAAGRARAVSREHSGRVGEHQQLVVQRVVQLASHRLGREADTPRGHQIGTPDIAHEQRVAGEHRGGNVVVRVLVHDNADRLGGVARGGDDLESDLPQRQPLTVSEALDGKLDRGAIAVGDDRAGLGRQLEVTAQEVGVNVRLNDPLDEQAPRRRLLDVDTYVPPGIDDDRPTGRLVSDDVGGVRQASQIVLREDHLSPRSSPGERAKKS